MAGASVVKKTIVRSCLPNDRYTPSRKHGHALHRPKSRDVREGGVGSDAAPFQQLQQSRARPFLVVLVHERLCRFRAVLPSFRIHRADGLANDIKPEISVPTAVAVMPKDRFHRPRSIVAAHSDLRQWTEFPSGGHFAAAEEPTQITEDIRSFVRPLRQS